MCRDTENEGQIQRDFIDMSTHPSVHLILLVVIMPLSTHEEHKDDLDMAAISKDLLIQSKKKISKLTIQ